MPMIIFRNKKEISLRAYMERKLASIIGTEVKIKRRL